jgi:hypothetical protein
MGNLERKKNRKLEEFGGRFFFLTFLLLSSLSFLLLSSLSLPRCFFVYQVFSWLGFLQESLFLSLRVFSFFYVNVSYLYCSEYFTKQKKLN